MLSWNINGVRNKLDDTRTLSLLLGYDVVFLSEVKTALPLSVPGFTTFKSEGENQHRGGCALLLRNYLAQHVETIDKANADIIKLQLSCFDRLSIIGVYIPPADSPFHTAGTTAKLQEWVRSDQDRDFVVLGDMNARIGDRRILNASLRDKGLVTADYRTSRDSFTGIGQNARDILAALDALVLVNNLCYNGTCFGGGLTFRRGGSWISELDLCFVSPCLLSSIERFEVIQNSSLPSDHGPIEFFINTEKVSGTCYQSLLRRATELGAHAATECSRTGRCKPQLRMDHLDKHAVRVDLEAKDPTRIVIGRPEDVDSDVQNLSDALYECARQNRLSGNADGRDSHGSSRWDTLIRSNDHKGIWRAIGWNGGVDKNGNSQDAPSDTDFKSHFEALLNPPEAILDLSMPDTERQVYMPVTDDPITGAEVKAAIDGLKSDKSGGPSGLPPGVMKWMIR